MRISNGYPDRFIGCAMFPEDAAQEDFGFGVDVAAGVPHVASGLDEPSSVTGVGSGLDDPGPPPLNPNDPDVLSKIKSGL